MKLSFNEAKYIRLKYGENKEQIKEKLLEPYSQFEERIILWLEEKMETEKYDPDECFGKDYDPFENECQIKCPIPVECKEALDLFKNKFNKKMVEEIKLNDVNLEEDAESKKVKEQRKLGREEILETLSDLVKIKKETRKYKGKEIRIMTKPMLKISNWDRKEITVYSTKGIIPYTERWKGLKIKRYAGVKVKIGGFEPNDLINFVEDMISFPIKNE